jgi:hypothetical protein
VKQIKELLKYHSMSNGLHDGAGWAPHCHCLKTSVDASVPPTVPVVAIVSYFYAAHHGRFDEDDASASVPTKFSLISSFIEFEF